MRRAKNLHAQVISWSNLQAAWREASAGKRRRPDVATFDLFQERELTRLWRELQAGRWRPLGYRLHLIREPKARLIAAAPFRDRVVHHAVHRVLAPILIRRFTADTFACLPGRGTHRAVLRFREGLRRHSWLARLDMQRYFLEIDWDILLAIIGRSVKDRDLERLLTTILESGAGIYDRPEILEALGLVNSYCPAPRKGLPIGNLTSQLFANVYLDGLDHFAKRELEVPAYLRYLDDVVLFGPSRSAARSWAVACTEWLAAERALTVHPDGGRALRTSTPHRFLGYVVSRERCLVAGRTVRRLVARSIVAACRARSAEELSQVEQDLFAAVRSLCL